MKRVWKPLDVGGLRLYTVRMCFNQHHEWNKDMVVAAKKPSHARDIIEECYKGVEFIEQPYFIGFAFNVFQPESWWINGIPHIGQAVEHTLAEGRACTCLRLEPWRVNENFCSLCGGHKPPASKA